MAPCVLTTCSVVWTTGYNKVCSWLTTFNFIYLQQSVRFKRIYFSLVFTSSTHIFNNKHSFYGFSVAFNNNIFFESLQPQTTKNRVAFLHKMIHIRIYAQRIITKCIHGKFSTCTRKKRPRQRKTQSHSLYLEMYFTLRTNHWPK